MPESYFALSPEDRRDALLYAESQRDDGRRAYLLEKDIYVVWALDALFSLEGGSDFSFKGGTSLSKVFGVINRFSEDIDVTYDIRRFLADENVPETGLPASRSQANKLTKKVRERLPIWLTDYLIPNLERKAKDDGIEGLSFERPTPTSEKIIISYPGLVSGYADYIRPNVLLEFGARGTGEPKDKRLVKCDVDGLVPDVEFPTATVNAMSIHKTFWEKLTAAHVYCQQDDGVSHRFSRHWHDLHFIRHSGYFDDAVADRNTAESVADHKTLFFPEKDKDGSPVDYKLAVRENADIIPRDVPLANLRGDYQQMIDSGLVASAELTFDEILDSCRDIQDRVNSD